MSSRILRSVCSNVFLQGDGKVAVIGLGGGLDVVNAEFVRQLLVQYAYELTGSTAAYAGHHHNRTYLCSVRTCTDESFLAKTTGALAACAMSDGVYCVTPAAALKFGTDLIQQVSINSETDPKKNYRSRYAEPKVALETQTPVYLLSCARADKRMPVRELSEGGGFVPDENGDCIGVVVKRDPQVFLTALRSFCETHAVDFVVFVDGGGDALIMRDEDDGGVQGAQRGQDYEVLHAIASSSSNDNNNNSLPPCALVVLAPGIDIKPEAFTRNVASLDCAHEFVQMMMTGGSDGSNSTWLAARRWHHLCTRTIALTPESQLTPSLTASTFYHGSGGPAIELHAVVRRHHHEQQQRLSFLPSKNVRAPDDGSFVFYTGARWRQRTPEDDALIEEYKRNNPSHANVPTAMFSVLKRSMCTFVVIADAKLVHP